MPGNLRRISRRQLLKGAGAAGLGVTALIIAGCEGEEEKPAATATPTPGAETETPTGTPSAAGDLIVAQASLWATLDQEFSVEHETQEAQVNQGARLIRYKYIDDPETGFQRQDVSGTPEGMELELAESFEISDDRKTYTFKLRRDIVSPAGNPFTADDVMYTIERKLGVNAIGAFVIGPLAMHIFSIDQVTRVDDYTVKFQPAGGPGQEPRPFFTFLSGIANAHGGTIVDSKLLKANATADDPWALEFAKNNTHGFGAYSVESFTAGQEAVWVANENYAHGPPAIKRMVWRVVPESATRLSLVQRGDVHIAKQMLSREQESVEGQAGITIPKAFTNLSVFLVLNLGHPPFDITKVRQAFLYTVPYDEIIQTVYRGRARRQFGMVWDPVPGAHPEYWEKYVTNIDKAKQLLAEAGLPDGFSIDWGYSLATPDMEEVSILMRDSAAQAGIRLNLQGLTPSALNEQNVSEEGQPRVIRDFAIVQTVYYNLSLFFAPNQPINWAGYDRGRAQSDAFWAEMQAGDAIGDDLSPEAMAHWDKAQQILAEDSPFGWVCWVDPAWIFRSEVKGYAHRTDNLLDYGRMYFG